MSCSYRYLEHGIGFNLRTFMSIINSGGIYSPATARQQHVTFMGSHVNPTGGDNLISVSIPGTLSSRMYSTNGITFIIDTTELQCGSSPKGTPIIGETYIKNMVPLSSVVRIYIPDNKKNTQLSDLDVCRLSYGSADVGKTLQYLFQGPLNSELTALQKAWDAVYPSVYQYQQSMILQKINKNMSSLEKQHKMKEIEEETKKYCEQQYTPLYWQCAQLFLQKLSQELDVSNIQNLTLTEFIVSYVKNQIGIDISSIIIHNLPEQ